MDKFKPDTPSRDHDAMRPYWTMVADLMDGTDAVRAAGTKYLPRFADEDVMAYDYRRKTAKYVGIYRDIIESLAAKPFTKEVAVVQSSATAAILDFAEDVDGQGNNLHVFAQSLFFHGINEAVGWIFVDHPVMPEGLNAAEEKARGARPYWIHIHAKDMLEVKTAMIGGREEFVRVRMIENEIVQDGFGEKEVKRVRLVDREKREDGTYGPARWEVFEEVQASSGRTTEWVSVASGAFSVGTITLVPFIAGRRKAGSWQFIPPMQDAAHMQIEHYQAESNLKSIKDQCAFPMLSGNGVTPDDTDSVLRVGPRTVLYAPMNGDGRSGSWSFVEPAGHSLTFLAKDIERIEQQLRELGRQPLTAQTGNLTVVTTAFAASKANSVIGAWALNLKDALEQALKFTALWLRDKSQPEVDIETEFDAFMDDEKGPDTLLKMRETNDLSQATLWRELKRRGILSAEFDANRELEAIIKEIPGEDGPDGIDAAVLRFPSAEIGQ